MGTVVFSLDTESIWGRIAASTCISYMKEYEKTSDVLHRLINLFDKYNIPATWAFVGLAISQEKMLNEFFKYQYKFVYDENEQQWFLKNFALLQGNPMKYSLLEHLAQLRASRVCHDIGSHTYSHLFIGWQNNYGLSTRFRNDLELYRSVSNLNGIDPVSFVYPRNYVGQRMALKEFGYRIYRDKDSDFSNIWFRRLNEVAPLKSFTVKQTKDETGMNVLQGSMIFSLRSVGFRKFLPVSWIYKKSCNGIDNAIKNNEVFHIWFHPFNFAYREESHFFYFEKLLKKIDYLRQEGQIEIRTMRDFTNIN